MLPAFVLAGVGMTLFFVPIASLVLGAAPAGTEGVASGANASFREIGGVFGIALFGAVFSSYGGYASPQSFVNGLCPASFVGCGALVLGVGTALFVRGRHSIDSHANETPTHKRD